MGVISNETILYLAVSCGMLRNKKKGINTRGYEGQLVGIS